MLMAEEVSLSTLPWCWVIETLARSQQVDFALLYEVVSRAPALSGGLGKDMREAIALRCLEGLFGPRNGSRDDQLTCHQSKIGFDLAESCEDVLQRILCESSSSNLQNEAENELKPDVCAFVERKKTRMPKCTLELLKNTILEGSHPLSSSLKEISGLDLQNQWTLNTPIDGGNPMLPSLRINENGHGSESMLINENGLDGQAMPIKENGHGSEGTLTEENRDSSRAGNVNQLVRTDLPNGNSVHSEKGRSRFRSENHVQETDNTCCDMVNHIPPLKKLKVDEQLGIQSKQQHSVHSGGSKPSNDAVEGQNRQLPKENEAYDGKSYEKNYIDRAKIYAENHNEPQISPANNGHHLEEIDLAIEKHTFLSSQCALSEDLLMMTETEPNICTMCNEGGDLLICSDSTCPIVIHQSCLRCSVRFDDQGNFYCPFCAYSRVISEYWKAKKKVSLARKELSLFVGGGTSCQPKHDSGRSVEKHVNQQGQNEDVDITADLKNGANVGTQVAKPQLARGVLGVQNQGQADHGSDSGKLSHENEKIANTSQECAELERKEESIGHRVTKHYADTSLESISESDGLSEDEKNKSITSLPSNRRLSIVPATLRLRRKKVPWTAEEEAMLKKGVEAFMEVGKATPWRNILEYGRSVFQNGRTAMDLKDKWRNIMHKKSPKVK